jgi:hypothetical protein
MKQRELKLGDVLQIDPEHDKIFGGCFMLVTEPETWGARGFVMIPGKGSIYYQCKFENMEYIGRAAWAPPDEDEAA